MTQVFLKIDSPSMDSSKVMTVLRNAIRYLKKTRTHTKTHKGLGDSFESVEHMGLLFHLSHAQQKRDDFRDPYVPRWAVRGGGNWICNGCRRLLTVSPLPPRPYSRRLHHAQAVYVPVHE